MGGAVRDGRGRAVDRRHAGRDGRGRLALIVDDYPGVRRAPAVIRALALVQQRCCVGGWCRRGGGGGIAGLQGGGGDGGYGAGVDGQDGQEGRSAHCEGGGGRSVSGRLFVYGRARELRRRPADEINHGAATAHTPRVGNQQPCAN